MRGLAVVCVAALVAAAPTVAHARSDGGGDAEEAVAEETVYVTGAPTCCLYSWGPTWMWLTWVSESSHDDQGNEITYAEVRYIREDAEEQEDDDNWTVVGAETDWQHKITGLELNVVYRYQVRVGSVAGTSPWSESFAERARTRPSPIYRPALTRGDGSLSVSWAQLPDSVDIDYTGYYVYWTRSDTRFKFQTWDWPRSEFIPSPGDCHASEDMNFIITGLDNGHSYDVLVRARSSWGDLSTPVREFEQSSTATPIASAGSLEPVAAFAPCQEPLQPVTQHVRLDSNPAFLVAPTPDPSADPTPDPEPEEQRPLTEEQRLLTEEQRLLTAEFVEGTVPAAHSGRTRTFTVRIQFSHPLRVSYKTLRDDLLVVTNGNARKFKRVDGRNDLWEIHIRPYFNGDVTLRLPAATNCTKTGKSFTQVCTAEGEPLSHDVTLTVPGPSADD